MKNNDFIRSFVAGALTDGDRCGNLNIRRGKFHASGEEALILRSYYTPIAAVGAAVVWVTDERYSVTTSRHTNATVAAAARIGANVARSAICPAD